MWVEGISARVLVHIAVLSLSISASSFSISPALLSPVTFTSTAAVSCRALGLRVRKSRAAALAVPSLCTIRATAGSEQVQAGDTVNILVKTVSFSRKLVASGIRATDLRGTVASVLAPEDPDDLAMATVVFTPVGPC